MHHIEVSPGLLPRKRRKDGYEAVLAGFQDKKEATLQSLDGALKKAGVTPRKYFIEFKDRNRVESATLVTVESFNDATLLMAVGTLLQRFQVVVKLVCRWCRPDYSTVSTTVACVGQVLSGCS